MRRWVEEAELGRGSWVEGREVARRGLCLEKKFPLSQFIYHLPRPLTDRDRTVTGTLRGGR